MAEFNQAIGYVLGNEGGLEIDAADPGGTTNFGISQYSYPALDIRKLTREMAIDIYRRDFWKFDAVTSQRLATKIFDAFVNSEHHAIRILQASLAWIQAGPVVLDGAWGPHTAEYVNAADENRLMDEFKARLAKAYCDTAIANPAESKDLLGWLRRAVKG